MHTPERQFDVICAGASAGGIEPLKRIVSRLPHDFPGSVFVVLHVPEVGTSVLPSILTRAGVLPVAHAIHGHPIRPGHVYVAPPGFHLTLEAERMRLDRGARENGQRPAIDPLFRSAALVFGARTIGVILSGMLDDGTVGLREIKRAGGLAIVQDPADTEWPSMPQSAMASVQVDHVLPASAIGELIAQQVRVGVEVGVTAASERDRTRAARELRNLTMREDEDHKPGEPSPYSCPECGGVLWEIRDGELLRFRCRVGHAYTSEALTSEQAQTAEKALWSALRALEEQSAIRKRLAERARRRGDVPSAESFDARARDLNEEARQVRNLILSVAAESRP